MNHKYSLQDSLDISVNSTSPMIHLEDDDEYISPDFKKKNQFLSSLLTNDSKTVPTLNKSEFENITSNDPVVFGTDAVVIRGWKNVENVSSKLLEFYDDFVILECLIDKEQGVYEERKFPRFLFSEYDLHIGKLFYLRFFERPNEARIEIHDDPKLTFQEDFPKKNFVELFKNAGLIK